MKIKTEIKIEGMDKLDKLLEEQQKLLNELGRNMSEIESIRVDLNLAINEATNDSHKGT